MSQGRLVDAGRLCAAQANAAPETTRYWNNVGLFYRDAGDELGRDRKEAADPETQQKYYEKALEGYERALALEPENPALLNDTAVVLHYCLERELERAGEMYKRSTEWAKIELARADLTPDERELFQTALKDSQNNLKRLEELRRRRAREAGKDAGAGEDPARKRSGR
jgi:tetratricopeptide (TPR) repeat protein